MSRPGTLSWHRPHTRTIYVPLTESLRRILAGAIVHGLRLLTGGSAVWVHPRGPGPCLYFANHASHFDTAAILSLLPAEERWRTRPVAAADYWEHGWFRRTLSVHVLRSLVIARGEARGPAALAPLLEAVEGGASLLLYPEGGRHSSPDPMAFRSGLYELAVRRPGLACVPVYLSDLWRAFPKGARLPVPVAGRVLFGPPLALEPGETKEAFLDRARNALRVLKEWPR